MYQYDIDKYIGAVKGLTQIQTKRNRWTRLRESERQHILCKTASLWKSSLK